LSRHAKPVGPSRKTTNQVKLLCFAAFRHDHRILLPVIATPRAPSSWSIDGTHGRVGRHAAHRLSRLALSDHASQPMRLLRAPPHVVVRQRSHHRATMHAEVRPYHDRPSNRTRFYGLDVAPFYGPTNEFLKTPAGTGWMSSQQDPEFLGYLEMEQHLENCIRHRPFQVVDESGGQDQEEQLALEEVGDHTP
jgi:hypothetical protein